MHVAGTQHAREVEGNICAAAGYSLHVVVTALDLTQ